MHKTPMYITRMAHRLAIASAVVTLAAGIACAPKAQAEPVPMVRTQAPGYYRLMLGDFEVTALSDGTVALDVVSLLSAPKKKTEAALAHAYASNPLEMSVNAYLVNTGSRLLLIDAGTGALYGPMLGKLLANLRASGYRPEQVDDIFITHMHLDHVGGLVADGTLAFPNATVHADKRDAEHWLSPQHLAEAEGDAAKLPFQQASASLAPYLAAGHFQTFESDAELVPGLRSLASHGHTVGHTAYLVESRGQRLMLIGDLIHVATQFDDPTVTWGSDGDAAAAKASRQRTFTQAAAQGTLIGSAHLPFPGLGHVRAVGKAWQWFPVGYTTQLR